MYRFKSSGNAVPVVFLTVVSFFVSGRAAGGEVKGRLLVGEKPASGVTVTAVPYEEPFEKARRVAQGDPAPQPLASATTGDDGGFRLTVAAAAGKPPRLFEVQASGSGVAATSLGGVFDSSEDEDLGEGLVTRGEALAGRVVDESGQPLASAVVTLTPDEVSNEDAQDSFLPQRATTGTDGTFRFGGAAGRRNTLLVEASGYAAASLSLVRSGALPRPVVLTRGLLLEGRVVKADKKTPPGSALVRLDGKGRSSWVEVRKDGTFSLRAPKGKAAISVDAGEAGYAAMTGIETPRPEGKPLVLVLSPPASIEGKVVDSKTGRAVPRVKLLARSEHGSRLARSGPDGRYRFRAIAPQAWQVLADEPRYVRFERDGLRVLAGETTRLDIPLVLGASIAGRVTDENGAPIAAARGVLTQGTEVGFRAMVRQLRSSERPLLKSGPDGAFKANRLQPGDGQRLTFSHASFEKTVVGAVSLPAGGVRSDVLVVMRQGLSVAGQVRDAAKEPVSGAEVELQAAMNFRGGRGGAVMQVGIVGPGSSPKAQTGPDGRFVLRGLSPADYTLSVRKSGYAVETVDPVKVAEGSAPLDLEVTLAPEGRIGGVVRRKDGSPVEGWIVNAAVPGRRQGPRRGREPETTGPDGAFSIGGLKSGETYDLQLFGNAGPGPQKRGVVAPADGVEIVVSGTGRIAGRAVDAATGEPLREFDATYEADRGSGGGMFVMRMAAGRRSLGAAATHFQGEDGSFALEEVPPGRYEVVVTAKGYQKTRVGGIVVEEGAGKDGVEVKAARGGLLKGRVTDARSGRGIPNVEVAANPSDSSRTGGPLAFGFAGDAEHTTDAEGAFEIESLPPGRYTVTARHADYADASTPAEVTERGGTVEVRLSSGGVLAGTVFSDGRRGLSGAEVVATAAGDAAMVRFGGDGQGNVADATGRFRIEHLKAGRYTVVASLRGKTSGAVEVVLQEGESKEDLVLTLAAGTTVRGFVSGLPPEERSGVSVFATGPESFAASTRTGADGRFELDGVPTGSITLRATAGDFMTSTKTALKQVTTVEGQPELETEIVFETGYTLSGRVLRGSDGVEGAMVFAGAAGGGRTSSARADETGSFRLEGLKEGTYTIQASAPSAFGFGDGATKRETVNLKGDQNIDLVLPTARLAGTVVESGTRQPLADAVVSVSLSPAGGGSPGFSMRDVTTDSNGRFSFEALEPRSYAVATRRSSFQLDKREATAAEHGSDALTIELTRGEGIGITARDGLYGVPLRGLMARVFDSQKVPVFTGPVSLDSEGRGEIPSLKPGRYSLVVDASGYAVQTVEAVNVPSSTVAIAMTPGGRLEIKSGEKTLAIPGARCRLLTPGGTAYPVSIFSPEGFIALATPVRGVENIAPGSYTLSVEGGASKPVLIQEGGRTVVELP